MKTKRNLIQIWLLCAVMLPAVVQAQFTYTNGLDYTITNGAITITGYTSTNTVVTIPDTINVAGTNLPVTSIGDEAFYYCLSLTSVTIPESVISIGDEAFFVCSSLANVTIPDGVSSIGYMAFGDCRGLTNLTIGTNVTSIGSYAFFYCTCLADATIPASVSSIGENAFTGCTSLTAITVDPQNPFYSSVNGVLFNKDQTTLVKYPRGLGGSYTIPGSVACISNYAFWLSDSLNSVTIGSSVTSIGDGAFEFCPGLTNATIGTNLTRIGDSAFSNSLLKKE